MGRLKKKKKKTAQRLPVRKKEAKIVIRTAASSKRPIQRLHFLPGMIVILIAALLLGLWFLAMRYPSMAATTSKSVLLAITFLKNQSGLTLGTLAVAVVVLLLAFFLPTKKNRKDKMSNVRSNKKLDKHILGSGWNDFVSTHFVENVKSDQSARQLFQKKTLRPLQVTIAAYETGLDALYNEVQKRGKVSLEEIEATFKITRELAEEWAHILEAKQLVQIEYPPFGSMLLTMPKKTEEES